MEGNLSVSKIIVGQEVMNEHLRFTKRILISFMVLHLDSQSCVFILFYINTFNLFYNKKKTYDKIIKKKLQR